MAGWEDRATRAMERFADGSERLPDDPDERQRQLTRMGNAAWAAGLSFLMLGRRADAVSWLVRAADTYRRSWADAPPGSWGRPIGAMKSRLIADDVEGAREDARWALDAGAADAEGPIGRYAAALALVVLGDDAKAADLAATLRGREGFPEPVADSLVALATRAEEAYAAALEALVEDFEAREEFLEDIPVADTVLALQRLAEARALAVEITSELLPA